MKILLLTHAFNSLTQRLFIELRQCGYDVSVEFDINNIITQKAIDLFKPDLIIAPFLKRKIPKSIWQKHLCLIVHPGIKGDRGPSALDYAIINNEKNWGVTVLRANEQMDGGDIYASCNFKMRKKSKSSLYRNEVVEAALKAIFKAIDNFKLEDFRPQKLSDLKIKSKYKPLIKQEIRKINWQQDTSEIIVKKINSADGFPGIEQKLFERDFLLFDPQIESKLTGEPGKVIATQNFAICIATIDGAIWIGYLCEEQNKYSFKLPATYLLKNEIKDLPHIKTKKGYQDIYYKEENEVGYIYFPFYNGAMDAKQCKRLQKTLIKAKRQKSTKVIVLMGGEDYWSNGMHLNIIEAAKSPADESWNNINAINDLALEIINSNSHIIIAALRGNAGAGGVFLARAADKVWAREAVILNPHYKDMGNLYGSEYWTYLLPKYTGKNLADKIMQNRLPMGVKEALNLGLIDKSIEGNIKKFTSEVKKQAQILASDKYYENKLKQKNKKRENDEKQKPLKQYRKDELAQMHLNFYGFDPSYHVARYNFVYKVKKSRTPITIAKHRRKQ